MRAARSARRRAARLAPPSPLRAALASPLPSCARARAAPVRSIRALGGLLSAHSLASDPSLRLLDTPYPPADGGRDLLSLAAELGERLLPAFDTPTAIPYGTVNLRHGVPRGESTIACTAAAGSLTLEFGALSRLTQDGRYHAAATRASRALWALRSRLDLVGAHVDTGTGRWTQLDSGVGRGIDSFLEYMLKDHLLSAAGPHPPLGRFRSAYAAVEAYTKVGDAYVDVSMRTGALVWPIVNALQVRRARCTPPPAPLVRPRAPPPMTARPSTARLRPPAGLLAGRAGARGRRGRRRALGAPLSRRARPLRLAA